MTLPPSYVWQPLKTTSDADFLRFSYFQSNAQYGQFVDAMAASADMQKIERQFEAMSECNSALMAQQQIYDGGQPPSSPPAYIHALACDFRDGAGEMALTDLNSHIRDYLDGSDMHKSFLVFQSVPLNAGPGAGTPFQCDSRLLEQSLVWRERGRTTGGLADGFFRSTRVGRKIYTAGR